MDFITKVNKYIYRIAALWSAVIFFNVSAWAQRSSFAVVIDRFHAGQLTSELAAYQQSLEKDGLRVFLLADDWKQPETIRKQLQELYEQQKLEGAILIGNIPVPMIRDAQHLTSTFKMPQTMDWVESSVPSDRFYDDFKLKFNFIKQDEKRNNLFYYQLDNRSPQVIKMDIYTGRLKPPVSDPAESVEMIRAYLKKNIAQRAVSNPVDQVSTYTAEGYNSNALTSWSTVLFGFRNQFRDLFNGAGNVKFSSYNNQDFMKPYWMTQLSRKDLDYAYFNGHGLPDYQIVSGNPEASSPAPSLENVARYVRQQLRNAQKKGKNPEDTKASLMTSLGINDTFFANAFDPQVIIADSLYEEQKTISIADIKSWPVNARLVYLDACFNGSFQLEEYIAGYYPFSKGTNVVTIANSVGVLQDLWANEMMGLIRNGTRIGQILKHSAYLETHIFGDPSFHFTAPGSIGWNQQIAHNRSARYWKKQLNHELPDVQALALRKIAETETREEAIRLLKDFFHHSKDEVVRTEAYLILKRLRPADWHQIIIDASKDNHEYLRRVSVYDMTEIGSSEFIQPLVNLYFNDMSSNRTTFNVERSLVLFDQKEVVQTIEKEQQRHPLYDQQLVARLIGKFKNGSFLHEYYDQLRNKTLPDKNLGFAISILRAYRMHQYVPDVIGFIRTSQAEEKHVVAALEALSWFKDSFQKDQIIQLCEELAGQKEWSDDVRYQAQRTFQILK